MADPRTVNEDIRAALDDVRSLPPAKYPSTWSVAANHPGIFGYQVMSEPEYQNRARYDELMRRLEAIKEKHGGMAYLDSPVAQQVEPYPKYTGPTKPYRYRGVLANGQPIRNSLDVLQTPFSLVANTARAAWDLDKAAANAPAVANRTSFGLWNMAQGREPNEAWAKERAIIDKIPFDSPAMLATKGDPGQALGTMSEGGIVEGPQMLKEDFGFPDNWKTDMAGLALEAAADPVTGATQAIRHLSKATRVAAPAARAAHLMRAGKLGAQEMYLPSVWVGLGELGRQQRESDGAY